MFFFIKNKYMYIYIFDYFKHIYYQNIYFILFFIININFYKYIYILNTYNNINNKIYVIYIYYQNIKDEIKKINKIK